MVSAFVFAPAELNVICPVRWLEPVFSATVNPTEMAFPLPPLEGLISVIQSSLVVAVQLAVRFDALSETP